MKAGNYHYLISGLPELSEISSENISDICYEVIELLKDDDKELFRFLLYKNDNKNIINFLRIKDGIRESSASYFIEPSIFSHADIENMAIEQYDSDVELPTYLKLFWEEYISNEPALRTRENRLLELYYETGVNHKNKFISKYFMFKRDIKNILMALNAREAKFKVERITIGDYDLPLQLKNNAAKDFGIGMTHSYITKLAELLQSGNLASLEKEIDHLIIEFCEEVAGTYLFTIENILVYLIKADSLLRWQSLTAELGIESLHFQIKNILSSVELKGNSYEL